ncbi:MAG: catalase [Mogibacterium sp.]|nr:catalase [Mogibacterium sp.]
MHPIKHFKTITEHRNLVCKYCIRIGLIKQGLLHDLSKYSPMEFWRGAVYYQGNRSPNDAERRKTGVSKAWLHHKGRNKHHFEYWIDYVINEDGTVGFGGNRMPKKYVAEMFCDRLAACRVYLGDKYTDASAYEYFDRARKWTMMHPETSAELEKLLLMLKDEGEDATFKYIRKWLKE